jgi:peptidoglycan/xylan/chitin deacetylase (PgdA/CDA1 family)
VKQLLLKSLLLPGFPALLRHGQRGYATIFVLHRFRDAEHGIAGSDPAHLRSALSYLSRNNYELVSVADLVGRLGGAGAPPRGAVAFTIDDGYFEQATVAAPLFAEFGCPVTTFVSTGFLDGLLWLWWDQIEHVFHRTGSRSIRVRLGASALEYRWDNEQQRDTAQADFTARCKDIPEAVKQSAIQELARAAGVPIPDAPPPRYRPMSWDQVRKCEQMGMTFGPHSVTHPVLSRTTQAAAAHEIAESWSRLRTEVRRPVPIFCYPNGGWQDFGAREIALLRREGLLGGLASEPGYASTASFQSDQDGRFRVQRFGFPDELAHMIQYVSGVERFKQLLRGHA